MSYPSCMTNHYQNARSDHANATKLQSTLNTTDIINQPQNLKPHKMKGSTRSEKNLLFFQP